MNSFEANKIFGAVLGTIFVLFGGSLLAEALFHAEAPEQPGYVIVAAEPGAFDDFLERYNSDSKATDD